MLFIQYWHFVYLNWNLFFPQFEIRNFRILDSKSTLICSKEGLLKTVLHHIQDFLERNDFPLCVIKQTFAEEEQKSKHQNVDDNNHSAANTER